MEAHPIYARPQEPEDPLGSTNLVPHEDAPAFSDIATTVMTTASPTNPGYIVDVGQNKPSKRRLEGKLEVLGDREVIATSSLRTGQLGALKADRVVSTKKGPWPTEKRIMGNPTDMKEDTSIIHTTTVINTMREQGMYIRMRCLVLSLGCSLCRAGHTLSP